MSMMYLASLSVSIRSNRFSEEASAHCMSSMNMTSGCSRQAIRLDKVSKYVIEAVLQFRAFRVRYLRLLAYQGFYPGYQVGKHFAQ